MTINSSLLRKVRLSGLVVQPVMIMRKVFPAGIRHSIISLQPMTMPERTLFCLDYTYKTTSGSLKDKK